MSLADETSFHSHDGTYRVFLDLVASGLAFVDFDLLVFFDFWREVVAADFFLLLPSSGSAGVLVGTTFSVNVIFFRERNGLGTAGSASMFTF